MRWRWRLYLSVIGSIGSSKWSARRPIVNSFPYNSIKQRYLPMCSNILSESNSWKDSPVTTRIRLDISEVFRIRERGKKKRKKGNWIYLRRLDTFFVSLSNPKGSIRWTSRLGCSNSSWIWLFLLLNENYILVANDNSCCVRK